MNKSMNLKFPDGGENMNKKGGQNGHIRCFFGRIGRVNLRSHAHAVWLWKQFHNEDFLGHRWGAVFGKEFLPLDPFEKESNNSKGYDSNSQEVTCRDKKSSECKKGKTRKEFDSRLQVITQLELWNCRIIYEEKNTILWFVGKEKTQNDKQSHFTKTSEGPLNAHCRIKHTS